MKRKPGIDKPKINKTEMKLVVIHSFSDYLKGHEIYDKDEIEKILNSDDARNIVKVTFNQEV